MEKKKMHYAWKIMAACILIKIGTGGFIGVAMGNFITPIVRELGCQVSQLTTYTSVNAISMALLYTTAARWINTKHIGRIMGFASVAEVIGLAMMGMYRSVEMFYLSGAIIGIAQAFTGFVALPIVINMWFKKNTGTVLGAVVSIGSAAAMLYSLLSGQLITHFGWRNTYFIMAAASAVITIPAVFLIIRRPEEVGCRPYGEAETAPDAAPETALPAGEYNLTSKQAFRLPLLYIAWIACVLYSYSCGVSGYTTTFSTMELGQSTAFGSVVGVCASLGGVLSSLIVGRINDKFGVKMGLLWGTVTTAIGYMMIFLSYSNPFFVYPSVFVVGLGSCMYMVQCPLLARNIVGSKHYSEIWARMMMINSLIGGGLYSTIGMFYDRTGTYRGAFIMAICMYAAAGVLGTISVNQSSRLHEQMGQAKA
ncbi:MAG: MFS transporter [Clostridiales bacterium]|nr:MFS transporter [Clostridiales bacterium]